MSNKINVQLADNIPEEDQGLVKKFTISETEFNYLKDLDAVKRSFSVYMDQLSSGYLKQVSLRLGYRPEQNLKFGIDLANGKRELTLTEVYMPRH